MIYFCIVVIQEYIKKRDKKILENSEEIKKLLSNSDEEKSKLKKIINYKTTQKSFFNYTSYMKNKKQIRESQNYKLKFFITKILDFPSNIIRKATIPPCDEDNYDHDLVMIWPFLGIPLINYIIFRKITYYWLFLIPIILIIFYFFFTYRKRSRDEKPNYYIYINLLGIFMSIIWIQFLTSILIDLFFFFNVLTNLNSTFIGLVFIVFGNCIDDGLITIALVSKGRAMMALKANLVSLLFCLFLGFGGSMLKRCFMSGESVVVDGFGDFYLNLVVVGACFGVLVFVFCYGVVRKRVFGRCFGAVMIFFYVVFLVFCTLISLKCSGIINFY